jgi:ABC-type thiamin/hydroxymethylpyrimidine transport system permease subunit
MTGKYYFSTKDLLLIALLCCLGGVMSTYVGYLGSTLGSLTGIPMGGQVMAGLHVFWIVLVLALVDRKGAGVVAGLLKGFVELISGGHLGVLVIPASLLEGIFAEIGFWPLKKYRAIAYPLAGGLSAWANILVTQTIFNAFPGIDLFVGISLLAFASGIAFAGYLCLTIVLSLEKGGMVRKPDLPVALKPASLPGIASIVMALFMVALLAVHFAPQGLLTADTEGASEMQPDDHIYFTDGCQSIGSTTYDLMDYRSQFITVTAVDPTGGNTVARNYTGFPLVELINIQCEGGAPRYVDVIGKDGRVRTFEVPEVQANRSILIVPNGTALDLVAPGYPEDMWVRDVDRFRQS